MEMEFMSSLVSQPTSTVVFVDGAIADAAQLSAYMRPGVEVVMLDPSQDGLTQITETLAGYSSLDSVQIFSHGAADQIFLGSTTLDATSLEIAASEVSQWSSAFAPDGDLLLYGCGIAAEGMEFLERLSELTGADVSASTDLTGRGGDWDLEVATGAIAASSALTAAGQAAFTGTLNTITVTSAANSGAGSLRRAISQATSGTVIRFAPGLANQTITLDSQLEISPGKNITIDGSGVNNLTISGNQSTRIFSVNSNQDFPTTFTVKNLSLVDGFTDERGGAIRGEHRASVVVDNVTFLRNVANSGGGAIYSPWENNLEVTNSSFRNNKATANNDERGAGAIAFVSPGTFTIRDSSFIGNEGINGGAVNSLNGKLTISGSRFINNNTLAGRFDTGGPNDFLRGFGGALYTDRASSTSESSGFINITDTIFEGNQGRAEGGAAYLFTAGNDRVTLRRTLFKDNSVRELPGGNDGNGGGVVVLSNEVNRGLIIDRSSFVNNSATNQGGGLWMLNAPTTITNSTFSGNQADGTVGEPFGKLGGAMALRGDATIVNSTVAYNSAGWVAGGILAGDDHRIVAKNTIFYRNTANNGGNDWQIQQHTNRSLSDGGGNFQFAQLNEDVAVENIRLADVRLAPLSTNGHPYLLSHALRQGSPAINAGVNDGAPTIDQSGTRRDGRIDAGAEEFVVGDPGGPDNPVNPPSNSPVMRGTPGADVLRGSAVNNRIYGRGGNDRLFGRGGNDLIKAGSGNDRLVGAAGRDRLFGQGGNDRITGGGGVDRLVGSGGRDILRGGGDRDILNGGGGNDRLFGDAGNDVIFTGAGRDRVGIRANQGFDTLKDYQDGQDKIDLIGIRFGQLTLQRQGDDVLVKLGNTNLLRIEDVRPSQLNAADFV